MKNLYQWLGTGLMLMFSQFSLPSQSDNLYYYLETLPPSIASRDFSRFTTVEEVRSYVDSCQTALQSLGAPSAQNLDEYIFLTSEMHDLVDQFPDAFSAPFVGSPLHFTLLALQAVEQVDGIDSERYSRIFADNLLYDCKDRTNRQLALMIAQDAFDPDSAYTAHVRYQVHRHSDFFRAAFSSLFATRNTLGLLNVQGELVKENIWMTLLLDKSPVANVVRDAVRSQYFYPLDADLLKSSFLSRQRFMDGTGLMLSLYREKQTAEPQQKLLDELQQLVSIVDRTSVRVSNPPQVHSKANLVHVLAYFQAWKTYLRERKKPEKLSLGIDGLAQELVQGVSLKPKCYAEAFKKYRRKEEWALYLDLPENSKNLTLRMSLLSINERVKEKQTFAQVDSLLPPIITWRQERLMEEKEQNTLLEYCVLCLDCIDHYFDNSFMWYTDYTSEETKVASEKRRKRLLAQGWTGEEGEAYVGANRVLDYAIDYLIRSQNYDNPSAPVLLYRAAKNKLEIGDMASARLYSKMSDDFAQGRFHFSSDWVDNRRVLAEANYKDVKDTTALSQLRPLVDLLEDFLKEKGDQCEDAVKYHDALIDIYNLFTDVALDEGQIDVAEEWNRRALDYLYYRKGSKWYRGGSVVVIPSFSTLSVLYRQWQISRKKGNEEQASDDFCDLFSELCSLDRMPGNIQAMSEIPTETKLAANRCWELRQDEDFVETVIKSSRVIRKNVQRYSALMHPRSRHSQLLRSQSVIRDYNGILAHCDDTVAAGCIFNNLLLFHGVQLLNERLIANAITFDKECQRLLAQSDAMAQQHTGELVSLFRSDTYAKKMEERALTMQGLKDLLSVDYTQIQKLLDRKELVIEFFKAPYWDDLHAIDTSEVQSGFYAALLKPEGAPVIVPLCAATNLPVMNPRYGFRNAQLHRISEKIWKPLRRYLRHVEKIYFTPDAELHNLPLEFLPYKGNRTVSDIFDTYRLSSSRVLLQHRQRKNGYRAALFGQMHYGKVPVKTVARDDGQPVATTENGDLGLLRDVRGTVIDLPHAEKEIKKIYQSFVERNLTCRTFTGNQATEEAFKSLSGNAPDVIHIATHGKYWPRLELAEDYQLMKADFLKNVFGSSDVDDALSRSVLLFSGANVTLSGQGKPTGEDQVLTAREISMLDLSQVDLLVLSACQTGLGDIQEDGVFGLQRGFKKAGVNSILMSLWEVDDKATQWLMDGFYRHYLNGCSKREALRRAQQEVRNKDGHAQKWAAFVLLDALED